MKGNAAIEVEALGKVYRDGRFFGKSFSALTDVTFEVRRGEIFGLLGPNGAGKTTFIKILLGIIGKTSGQAWMLGHNAGSRAGRQQVGYLPEQLRIPQHMTGYTALEYYGNLSGVSTSVIRKKRPELLKLVGLFERGGDPVKKYSKGMRQRLGLAQALLHDPKLLVLDEPTDGLDPGARAEMRQIIRRLCDDGVTIFLNSHILQEVELICGRVAILHKGELRYCGSVSEIGDFVRSSSGASELQVEIVVAASEDELKKPTEGWGVTLLRRADRCVIAVESQSEVDRVVDLLRENKFSIAEIRRRETTLEAAFLKIVGSASGSSENQGKHWKG